MTKTYIQDILQTAPLHDDATGGHLVVIHNGAIARTPVVTADNLALALYGLGMMTVVAGPMVAGTTPPQMAPSTAAHVAHLIAIGIPEAYIGWSVTGEEAASGATTGSFGVPAVTLQPMVSVPYLTGVQSGSFIAPAVTLRPQISAPALSGIQGGGFALPGVILQPQISAPALVGLQAGNFALPTVTLQPSVSAPLLDGVQAGVGVFTLPPMTLQPQVVAPTLAGAQVGAFTVPAVTLQPVVAAPTLLGAQAGSFAVPAVSLRPVVSVPSLTASTAPTVPATPTQSALTVGDGQLTANWTDVSGETGYTVYYSRYSAFDGANSNYVDNGEGGYDAVPYPTTPDATAGKISVAANSASQVISGLTNGVTYYVKVSATNANGESALSAVQSASPAAMLTTFTDTFNRADAATLGADWVNASWASSGLKVLSNKAQGQAGGSYSTSPQSVSYLNPATRLAPANQYAQCRFAGDLSTYTASAGLLLRVSATQETYYHLNGSGFIYKVVNGSGRSSAYANFSSALGSVTNTDVIKFTAEGTTTTTLKVYKNGILIGTATDSSSPITSGQPGLRSSNDTTDTIDDFAAGVL